MDNSDETTLKSCGGIVLGGGSAVSVWSLYSLDHIYAAFHFAKLSKEIENAWQNERTGMPQEGANIFSKFFRQDRAYVTASIFSAIAFLEATINELFSETVDNPTSYYANQLSADARTLLATFWKLEVQTPNSSKPVSHNFIDRLKTLDKFQVALTLAQKPTLDSGTNPYQDVATLITIRNVLIHYKPQEMTIYSSIESIPADKKFNEFNFSELEKSNKFPQNPLFEGGNAYFPDRCLGSGCAQWAAKSSLEFVELFYSNMGLTLDPSLKEIVQM